MPNMWKSILFPVANAADMSDSVKRKKLMHYPLCYWGFHFICRTLVKVGFCKDAVYADIYGLVTAEFDYRRGHQ